MKTRTRNITIIIMAVVFVGLIGWDIYVFLNDTEGDTISEITLSFTQKHTGMLVAIVWSLGFLMGHLFWPQRIKR